MKKLIVLGIFVLVFIINGLDVEAVICCQKLEGRNNYCTDVGNNQESLCDDSFGIHKGIGCDFVNECQVGCCVSDNGGSCYNDRTKASCDITGGTWFNQGCNDVPICRQGCCLVGDNALFSSDGECRILARDKGLSFEFIDGIVSDAECQAQLDIRTGNQLKGCCVRPDGLCSFGTAGECSDGGFARETACFKVNACQCEVGYSCLGEDVHQISSCGDDVVVDDCDGVTKSCNLVRSGKDQGAVTVRSSGFFNWEVGLGDNHVSGATGDAEGIACVPVSCKVGEKFVNTDSGLRLISSVDAQHILTITSNMLGGHAERNNGESWCISPVAPDEPGSRHYVYRCVEGKIDPEGCKESRKEKGICAEETKDGFTEARCVDNDWTAQKAVDENVKHPPAIEFYGESDVEFVSVGESCGFCNKQDDWWNPLDNCDENACTLLGDCSYDGGLFSVGGCIAGALLAEALWLTAGSIAAIGEGEGIATGSEYFSNTGVGGFFDTGPFGDVGKQIIEKRIDGDKAESLAKGEEYLLQQKDAPGYLRNVGDKMVGERIWTDDEGFEYVDNVMYVRTKKGKDGIEFLNFNQKGLERARELGITDETLGNIKVGEKHSGNLLKKAVGTVGTVAQGTFVAKSAADLFGVSEEQPSDVVQNGEISEENVGGLDGAEVLTGGSLEDAENDKDEK